MIAPFIGYNLQGPPQILKAWKIIHVNLYGPMQVKSIGESRYFLLLKNNFSHFRIVYFISRKTEVEHSIEDILNKGENQCPTGIECFKRTTNWNSSIRAWLDQRIGAYTPKQNGKVERENRKIRCDFLEETISTATYVLNAWETSCVKNITPFERWIRSKP